MDSQMRGYLWTRNCGVFFGLAIAWFLWARNCVAGFMFLVSHSWFHITVLNSKLYIPGLGMLWRPRPCFAASPWTALYSWFYIPGSIFLVLYSWLCIPGFQISHFRFQIPEFRLQISDVRFQIPYFRFQISDLRFQLLDFRFQISDVRFQIFQISYFRFHI